MTQGTPGTTAPGSTTTTPAPVASIAGRIDYARSYRDREGRRVFLTLLKLPAPDQFTSPQTIEVRSTAKLGEVGDSWRGSVRIGGYGKSYSTTDPETGEKRPVRTADNLLTVVE